MSILHVICLHSQNIDTTRLLLCVCKDVGSTIWADKLVHEKIEPCDFWTPKMTYIYHKKDLRILMTLHSSYDCDGDGDTLMIDLKLREYNKETVEIIEHLNSDMIHSILLPRLLACMRYYVVIIFDWDIDMHAFHGFDNRLSVGEYIESVKDYGNVYGIIDIKHMCLNYIDMTKSNDITYFI